MADVNNVENVVKGVEIMEDIPKVHVVGKNTTVGIVAGAVLTGGIAYGVYRLVKHIRSKKGVIDGEIIKAEEDPTEEK